MASKKLLVLIERSRRDVILDISKSLADSGMTVEKTLKTTGMITGHADESVLGLLNSLPGVQMVKEDGVMKAIKQPETSVRQHSGELTDTEATDNADNDDLPIGP